jgi:CrcB protein
VTAVAGVFVAGAAGAAARYVLDGALQERWDGAFPIGTFVVNVVGAFLLGSIVGVATARSPAPDALLETAGVGFVGSFTTFSTLAFESLRLLREGSARLAFVNLAGSVVAGLAAASLGLALGASL